MKKGKFISGGIFHVFNKSIANYGIFKDIKNADRFRKTLDYYNNRAVTKSLSRIIRDKEYQYQNLLYQKEQSIIKFLCYCIMPDHYHLLVKILKENIFSKYVNDIENSFTRYFNIKFNRKGPLWQSGFKAVRIKNNEQLLHISRYIHLNPTTSNLVEKPEEWQFSSYRDFIFDGKILKDILHEISIGQELHYKKFVDDQIDYQRKLKFIKKYLLE